MRLFLDERSTTEATARLQSGKALLGAAAVPFDPTKNIRDRPAYDKSTDKRPPWHTALTNCRHCDGKHYNNSCHLLRENGGPGVPFKSEPEQAARRERRAEYATRRTAKAQMAKKAKNDTAAATAAPTAAPAPATGTGFVAGGARDIETIVVPPGTAHTEPADSLIATLFGDGTQSLSLADAGGSALWVASSLASGLEELAAVPQAPGEPIRGTIGRGGAAVMKGTLKTSITPSPPPPIVPGTGLEPHIELEPHLAPGPPRERIVHSSMRLYVDNSVGKGGPGIRYGQPDAPDFLHELMEGTHAFKPGIPNRRLIEDGSLSSAITCCVPHLRWSRSPYRPRPRLVRCI